MHYRHKQPLNKKSRGSKLVLGLTGVCFIGGLYLLALVMWPALPVTSERIANIKHTVKHSQPVAKQNRVYIPAIGVNEPIASAAEVGLSDALDSGIAHLQPKSGNPVDGGNFVLAGHRFDIALTPTWTVVQSPLYHIEELDAGEMIYVDYDGTRYAYKVTNSQHVDPTNTSIVQSTEQPRLTLYTCQLSGAEADRVVVFAEPVGKVAWVNGVPKLKAL